MHEESEPGNLHSDAEQSFTSDFVSEELYRAVNLCYEVTKIWEVWHYKSIQFDGTNPDSGLFNR